jgi:hypothetical protein
VIYLNATDPTQPYGYNPLRDVSEDRIAMAASGMMDVFKKMWPDAWGVRMEHILRNVLMALLEQPDATLHDVQRIFSDSNFRKSIARSIRNDTVRRFLLNEFERFSFGYRADGTAPIQNKVGAFLADPLLDRILTSPEKDLHIRQIMDEGQVLLVNLAKGHIDEDSSAAGAALYLPSSSSCWQPCSATRRRGSRGNAASRGGAAARSQSAREGEVLAFRIGTPGSWQRAARNELATKRTSRRFRARYGPRLRAQ